MRTRHPVEDCLDSSSPERRDRGTSLIEVLIAVVLLGVGVAAMLTSLTVTIDASATERDHANAHAWLQTAADVLYGVERKDCGTLTYDSSGNPTTSGTDEASVRAFYEQEIKNVATNPEGWPADNIEIIAPVKFWNGEIYQDVCFDDQSVSLQLITIQVRNMNDEIVERVEVVKG